MDAVEQARRYISKADGAVSGSGGHNDTFQIACVLTQGFGLSIDESRPLLQEFNARCQPPWSDRELEHKLTTSAAEPGHKTRDGLKPRGWMRSKRATYVHKSPPPVAPAAPVPRRDAKAKRYTLDKAAVIPEPIPDGTRALLRAAFIEGEGVAIAQAFRDDDGRERPKDAGTVWTREKWLAKLDAHGGNPNGFLKSTDRTGIFIRINPMQPDGAKDEHVSALRHALIEFDDPNLTAAEQWDLIQQSRIPCTAVLSSGGKSIHAWVRVDARDKAEYQERLRLLHAHFDEHQRPDPKNINPSRFSRLPNCVRGDRRQELLALGCGAASWEDWCMSIEDTGLPEIELGADFIADEQDPEPATVIDGVLHQGSKLVIGAGSKSYKTFTLLDLGLSVSAGVPWWGKPTTQGKVLYINFEIRRWFFRRRVQSVAKARGITITNDAFHVWNLRGYSASVDVIVPKIIKGIRTNRYALIIIDPIYKALGNRDENKAGDMNDLLDHIERLASHSGAATVFAAHFSKGNQSTKYAIDRISGSGVFGRDPDAILTMTNHAEDGCYTIDYTLRDMPPLAPIVVRWNWPTFSPDDSLNPQLLKEQKQAQAKAKDVDWESLKNAVPLTGSISKEKLIQKLQAQGAKQGAKPGILRCRDQIAMWLEDEFLHEWRIKRDGKKPSVEVSRKPQEGGDEPF